jgi:ParB/RepB/Spo0J family partition protein
MLAGADAARGGWFGWGDETVKIEIEQLELKYRELRIEDPAHRRQLASALLEHGQQNPVLVVPGQGEKPYVLIDGYARVAVLRSLARDEVEAWVLPVGEPEALVLGHRLDATRRPSALEEGWLVRVLIEEQGMSQVELAARLHRSVSWVSRRLSLVRVLPAAVQTAVQRGRLPAHGAMKYLVPLARAKGRDCEALVEHLPPGSITVRQMQQLYEGWKSGDPQMRAYLVTHPRLYLKSRERSEALVGSANETSETTRLIADLEAMAVIGRRVRHRMRRGHLPMLGASQHEALLAAWREVALIGASLERLFAPSSQEQSHA